MLINKVQPSIVTLFSIVPGRTYYVIEKTYVSDFKFIQTYVVVIFEPIQASILRKRFKSEFKFIQTYVVVIFEPIQASILRKRFKSEFKGAEVQMEIKFLKC